MTELLIGTGGWAYFHVPGLRSLEAYSRAFDFVEVNSTFYRIPSLKLVESWRLRVPTDFEFAVRCHKDITHKYRLEPVEEAFSALDATMEICQTLNSKVLVFETPTRWRFNEKKIGLVRDFFESVDLRGVTPVWEVRRRKNEPLPAALVGLMQDLNIVHCVDLSKENEVEESEFVYTRLFGKGEQNVYQFADEELTAVDEKIVRGNPERAAVSFHNVRMYKDAARFRIFKQTGKFPSVTGSKGQQSLRKVLMEDARFPATKSKLLKAQGWKIVDLTEDKRVRASSLLERLPDKEFGSVEEVMNNLPRRV